MTDRQDALEPDDVPVDEAADEFEPEEREPEDDELDEGEERAERRSDVVIVTLVFVVLFAYQLYSAVANLVALPQIYAEIGLADAVPWPVLYAGVAVPPVLFAAASAVARGRRLAARGAILVLGLAVSAQLSLLLEELARQAAVTAFGG
ncbi:hypothetical protein GCM10009846_07620 [Agrococcus versicolor]|uniref:MFS transporter n=1 Tax=Agrococcus versicolor TaxID=501482 RepID=A0ABP5MG49_9MICO